jgi:hypothetical protein
VGDNALSPNTSGSSNTAVGNNALSSNTTGNYNIAVGERAVPTCTTGEINTGIGHASLFEITTGDYNIGLGYAAGRYVGSGTTPNQTSKRCIYIGTKTRAGADGRVRENVIGENVTGNGNDTTTIGEKPVFPDMPTSSSGLPSGALWNDSGTVKIV